jgi:hypothetical protein
MLRPPSTADTMPDDLSVLVAGCLDGTATPADEALLAERMRTDAAARDLYLQLADLHACLAVDETLWIEPPLAEPPSRRRAAGLGRLAAAAALGLAVGLCGAGFVSAYVVPLAWRPVAILHESFEDGPPPLRTGMPHVADLWSGDDSAVVTAEQGVRPLHGAKMLRMQRADYDGKESRPGSSADMQRIIDLRGHDGAIAAGRAKLRVAVPFNATFPDGEAYTCRVTVYALDTDSAAAADFSDMSAIAKSALAMAGKGSPSLDRDTCSWQTVETELRLPPGTSFALVVTSIVHQKPITRRPTFDGHFIDGIRVNLEMDAGRPLVDMERSRP